MTGFKNYITKLSDRISNKVLADQQYSCGKIRRLNKLVKQPNIVFAGDLSLNIFNSRNADI